MEITQIAWDRGFKKFHRKGIILKERYTIYQYNIIAFYSMMWNFILFIYLTFTFFKTTFQYF